MKARFLSLSGFCLAAVFAFEAPFPVFADGTAPDFRAGRGSVDSGSGPEAPKASPPSTALDGNAAAPADSARPVSPVSAGPRALREMQAKEAARRDSLARAARRDSLARDSLPRNPDPGNTAATHRTPAPPDTQPYVLGEPRARDGDGLSEDARAADEERAKGWFANLFLDWREGGGKGDGLDADDWAALIYIVVGVVVVGAFLIYGIQTLVELAVNREQYPLFQEAGLRLSYSGHSWRDGAGADLYRDAYLAGIRYGVGFDRPGADIGLALEGGYLDIRLSPSEGVGDAFDFRGGYLIAGPLLRFGSFDPLCFSLEFLNGTSTHASIGWISKARMSLQARFGRHEVAGAHLGAVFYDLSFLDGLAWRRGDLNRDLSLIGGVDFGWEF